MLTLPEFHPLASGAGMRAAKASVGATVSRLKVSERVKAPPADVAVQVKVTPAVSWVTELGVHPLLEVTADSLSMTDHWSWMLLRYQPCLPAVPVQAGTMMGGVVSVGAGVGSPLMRRMLSGLVPVMYSRPAASNAMPDMY